MKFTIDREFQSLIPTISAEELAGLTASLLQDGCRDPFVVWNGLLLDGHHRAKICREHKIKWKTTKVFLPDREAAKVWIIQNQFARRNLTPFQRGELAILLEPMVRAQALKRRCHIGHPRDGKMPGEPISTNEAIGKAAGMSKSAVAKTLYISKHASEKTKNLLRQGKTTLSAEYQAAHNYAERDQTNICKFRQALQSISTYDPPSGQSPSVTVDKLQDIASRALLAATETKTTPTVSTEKNQ